MPFLVEVYFASVTKIPIYVINFFYALHEDVQASGKAFSDPE
jgi:hypothetical protein